MEKNEELWSEYYQRALSFPHRPLTEFSVSLNTSDNKVAVDCGCGTGSDTQYLADAGYQVHAFDINADSVDICNSRFESTPLATVSRASFESFNYPKSSLVIANASLYFSEPTKFVNTWANIVNSIEAGGVFAGDFMGVEDDWAHGSRHTINALTKLQIAALFERFEIIRFKERNEIGKTSLGKSKRWHTYTVVAVKRS